MIEGRWYIGGLRRLPIGPIVWHRATAWGQTATVNDKIVAVIRKRCPSNPHWFVDIKGWEHWLPPNSIRSRWQFVSPTAIKGLRQAKRHVEQVIKQGQGHRDDEIGPGGLLVIGDCKDG